jgi:hypothetical protein
LVLDLAASLQFGLVRIEARPASSPVESRAAENAPPLLFSSGVRVPRRQSASWFSRFLQRHGAVRVLALPGSTPPWVVLLIFFRVRVGLSFLLPTRAPRRRLLIRFSVR